MPGSRVPMVDEQGRINPIWQRLFNDLYERTGGGAVDKVELGATGAEAANAAAVVALDAAATAQAVVDDIDRRIDFDFDFDLR